MAQHYLSKQGLCLTSFLVLQRDSEAQAYPIGKFNFLEAISSVMEYKTAWMAHIFSKYAWHCAYSTE